MNRREVRRYTQTYERSADEIFPLLCPVREAEWLQGFEYDMVYSDSGMAEDGCVFTTSVPGEPDTVWTITKHDRERKLVEFFRVTPGIMVTRLEVLLADKADGGCTAGITYTFTSLGPDGDEALNGRYSEAAFVQMAQLWEKSLNRFLQGNDNI